MRFGNIGEGVDEGRRVVQALRSLDGIFVARLANDFEVQLVQRFNMVRGECDGDEDQVCLALGDVILDRVAGLRAKPCLWTNLRLPDQAVGMRKLESLHYSVHGRGHLGRVRIT